jgi:hypothetical protein
MFSVLITWNEALLDCVRISEKMLLAVSQDQSSDTMASIMLLKKSGLLGQCWTRKLLNNNFKQGDYENREDLHRHQSTRPSSTDKHFMTVPVHIT